MANTIKHIGVTLYHKDGRTELVRLSNPLSRICKRNGLRTSDVYRMANGHKRQVKGWSTLEWSKHPQVVHCDARAIVLMNEAGDIKSFRSILCASRAIGCHKDTLYHAVAGRRTPEAIGEGKWTILSVGAGTGGTAL